MHRCRPHRCIYSPNTSAGSSWAPGSYGRRKPPPARVPGKPRPFRSAVPLPTGSTNHSDAGLATRTARRAGAPLPPPTPSPDLCRRGPPRRGPRRLKSTAPGTYAAGAPVSTLRWRETPQGAGEPHDTPSHKRTRHNSSYVLRTSRLAAPGPHRVRHAGRFTGHSGPILPGGVFLATHMSPGAPGAPQTFFFALAA